MEELACALELASYNHGLFSFLSLNTFSSRRFRFKARGLTLLHMPQYCV